MWNTIDDILQFCLLYRNEATFLDLALYYSPFIIFYFTANASSLLIIFKYARVETTCHFLKLFSETGVFRVFDRDFPFGIGSSVRYFTILVRSELPGPIKILICRIGRGVPNDFDIVYKKKRGNMAAFSVEGKRRKKLEF